MADTVDPETRSRMMRGIRGINTKPELSVRSRLHAAGFGYGCIVRIYPAGLILSCRVTTLSCSFTVATDTDTRIVASQQRLRPAPNSGRQNSPSLRSETGATLLIYSIGGSESRSYGSAGSDHCPVLTRQPVSSSMRSSLKMAMSKYGVQRWTKKSLSIVEAAGHYMLARSMSAVRAGRTDYPSICWPDRLSPQHAQILARGVRSGRPQAMQGGPSKARR